jgi:transposase
MHASSHPPAKSTVKGNHHSLEMGIPIDAEFRGFALATTRYQWRMLPKDFPPCSTVQRYFYEWRSLGLWSHINHHLVMEARELEGRGVSRQLLGLYFGAHS